MAEDITLTEIMNHMHLHATTMRKEFRNVHKRIDAIEQELHLVKTSVFGIDTKVENIDIRLDDIEIELLPKRVHRIEYHLSLS